MSVNQTAPTHTHITAEQFWALPDTPEKGIELVRGEVVAVPSPGNVHNLIAFLIAQLLAAFVNEHDLGVVFGDNTSYLLSRNPDTVRIPDVSYVSWERIAGGEVPRRWTIAPDLAVEIVSPDDRSSEVDEKVSEYLAAGTPCVWVLWPATQSMHVHTAEGSRELGTEDILAGGDLLPAFQVRVADLFNVRTKRLG